MNRWILALALLTASCSQSKSPLTAVIVTVDADSEVQRRATTVQVSIRGGIGSRGSWRESYNEPLAPVEWPFTFALAPRGGDPLRGYEIVIAASDGGGEFSRVRAISSYVPDTVIALPLLLEDKCIDVSASCDDDQTCTVVNDVGVCMDARVDADEAGQPTTDSGAGEAGTDSGAVDGGPTPDTGPPNVEAGPEPECQVASECDDDEPCTIDSCGATTGVCIHEVLADAEACDDDNTCTWGDQCTSGICGGTDGCLSGDPLVPLAEGSSWCDGLALYSTASSSCTPAPGSADTFWCTPTQGHICEGALLTWNIPDEGEIRAFSLSAACPSMQVLSGSIGFGGVSDFVKLYLYRDDCSRLEVTPAQTICATGDVRFAIGPVPEETEGSNFRVTVPADPDCDIML